MNPVFADSKWIFGSAAHKPLLIALLSHLPELEGEQRSLDVQHLSRMAVAALYAQHTEDTGQVFPPDAVVRAFELTQGQPWLVNALARQVVEVVVPDPAEPITRADVDRAKEILIERQDTHLDSLVDKLEEPRIHVIIAPILPGRGLRKVSDDDRRYATDLGLVRKAAPYHEIAPHHGAHGLPPPRGERRRHHRAGVRHWQGPRRPRPPARLARDLRPPQAPSPHRGAHPPRGRHHA